MSATFTDGDVEKRVENANGETLGVVAEIDDEVAYVEPRSGVMDSIRAALGWDRAHEETVRIRGDSVDEITAETIRLEMDSLDRDDTAVADDRRGSATTTDRGGETDNVGAGRSIDATDDPGDSAALGTTEERDVPTAADADRHADGPERETGGRDDAGSEPALETDAELQDELDRGTKVEPPAEFDEVETGDGIDEVESGETIDEPIEPEPGSPETADRDPSDTDTDTESDVGDELDTGTDLESVATDERDAAGSGSARDPAAELNEGSDLEAAADSTRGPDTEIDPETLAGEAADSEGRAESGAVDRPRVGAEVEPGADEQDTGLGSVRPETGIAGHTALDEEGSMELPPGAVGSKARTPDATVERDEGVDRDRRSRSGASVPFESLLAAQRTAMAGPMHLFSQGVAFQRAVSEATLRAIEGQAAIQRLGLEAVGATTRASRQAVGDPTETGRTRDRSRSASVESATADLYAAHSKLLDAFERELEAGIDAVDGFDDAQVDALAAGTDLLLAVDRELDETTADADVQDLERHLDRTRSVYERLDEQFELRRHEPTAALPAQLEQLEQYLQ